MARLKEELAESRKLIAKLTKERDELRARISKNSSNSHKPPSSDTPDQRKTRNKDRTSRKDKKRKRGAQPGHPGHSRGFQPAEKVDEFFDYRPEACGKCGSTELNERDDLEPRRMQQVEIPVPKPLLHEHRQHAAECVDCGHLIWAELPKGVLNSSFGPGVHAQIALLTGAYNISRRNACKLMSELHGIDISVGALSRCEERMSEAVAPAVEEARDYVRCQPVKNIDATGWLNQGQGRQAWALVTPLVVAYFITADGTQATVKQVVGKDSEGIMISDRATVFNFWAMDKRQVCWAHLLRKFISFAEMNGLAGMIGGELVRQTQLMFHHWHLVCDGTMSRAAFQRLMAPKQQWLEELLKYAVTCNIYGLSGSCQNVLDHRDALWTFVGRQDVQPTNNAAERALRQLVLWRKRSHGSQSERGERFTERMLTTVESLRVQERDVLSYLRAAIENYSSHENPPSLLPDHGT